MVYLNIIQCTSISSREVLLGPVCAAFLGCQQMEKVLEKSVNMVWMIDNYLFPYTQDRSLKKKKKKGGSRSWNYSKNSSTYKWQTITIFLLTYTWKNKLYLGLDADMNIFVVEKWKVCEVLSVAWNSYMFKTTKFSICIFFPCVKHS